MQLLPCRGVALWRAALNSSCWSRSVRQSQQRSSWSNRSLLSRSLCDVQQSLQLRLRLQACPLPTEHLQVRQPQQERPPRPRLSAPLPRAAAGLGLPPAPVARGSRQGWCTSRHKTGISPKVYQGHGRLSETVWEKDTRQLWRKPCSVVRQDPQLDRLRFPGQPCSQKPGLRNTLHRQQRLWCNLLRLASVTGSGKLTSRVIIASVPSDGWRRPKRMLQSSTSCARSTTGVVELWNICQWLGCR